eukprot:scaffold5017_cov139-Isochrysis_galbana.AAC.3
MERLGLGVVGRLSSWDVGDKLRLHALLTRLRIGPSAVPSNEATGAGWVGASALACAAGLDLAAAWPAGGVAPGTRMGVVVKKELTARRTSATARSSISARSQPTRTQTQAHTHP